MRADPRLAGVLELLGLGGGAPVRAFPPTPTPWACAYAVGSGATRGVARLIDLDFAEEGVVATEFAAATLLGDHGIGPRVRHADAEAGVLVMDEIDGAPAERPVALWQALSLARVLRALHALDMPGEPRLHVAKEQAATAAVAAIADGVPELALHREASRRFDDLRAALARLGVPDRLCHNDLNHGNVVFDDVRAWLIDFDHLGVGDPFYDLANAVLSLHMDDVVRQEFVKAYLGRPADAGEEARLELMSCLVQLRYGLSALSLVPTHLHDRLGTWTSDMVGDPFDFRRRDGEEVGWLVFRLSLSFVHKGLERLGAEPATRAAETLGLLGARV
ncbi:Phosphotransferase enzyme family protein [Lentzea fradiae]|uniref:Phosphotransferase enzyme family protein n=1 Tax=Lentzea fradiae TaxID=200378 RepID=A0A1G7XHY6_9PSEU|nr:aminoglycoside phosphotransferase family protein [Lentzea fradiae]SDG83717.1 Phosphotransferase enzyme family protein [Lentzea fradiae]